MLNLRSELARLGKHQAALARHLGISTASVSLIINYDRWPKGHGGRAVLRERIAGYLIALGADPETVHTAFDEAPTGPRANADQSAVADATTSGPQPDSHQTESLSMLLRHATINRDAKAHFKLPRDPFVNEMHSDQDVFTSDDIRYVRAAMRQTAVHGGMLAVVGESGGGKSTLRKDLIQWIGTSGEPITVIEPYVLGMEANERKGQALKAGDITSAVIRAIQPGKSMRANPQDRAAQMHAALKASGQIGRKHVLIIEEAHGLATPTLKHLKRFYELEDGFKKLLSIILIGQTELEWKLSEHNPDVREVVQRCEMVKLQPLDNHIEAYLRHKFSRVEVNFDAIFEGDVVDEIRNRLRHSVTDVQRGQRAARMQSLCHPLAINNLVSLALNEAVKIGAPKVDAGLIAAAVKGS